MKTNIKGIDKDNSQRAQEFYTSESILFTKNSLSNHYYFHI